MKLSKLYANKSELFEPITFVSGLNVVLAEIRLPENKKKDTHNLGKTTLCATSQDEGIGSFYWLLALIMEKQEQTITNLWKAQAKNSA